MLAIWILETSLLSRQLTSVARWRVESSVGTRSCLWTLVQKRRWDSDLLVRQLIYLLCVCLFVQVIFRCVHLWVAIVAHFRPILVGFSGCTVAFSLSRIAHDVSIQRCIVIKMTFASAHVAIVVPIVLWKFVRNDDIHAYLFYFFNGVLRRKIDSCDFTFFEDYMNFFRWWSQDAILNKDVRVHWRLWSLSRSDKAITSDLRTRESSSIRFFVNFQIRRRTVWCWTFCVRDGIGSCLDLESSWWLICILSTRSMSRNYLQIECFLWCVVCIYFVWPVDISLWGLCSIPWWWFT